MNAVIDGQVDAVRHFLHGGTDVDASDKQGWTALHFAVQNADVTITSMLLQAGANLSARDSNGNTPLFRAVFSYRNGTDCISPLLAAGADPDAANDHGVSPRSLAKTIANYDAAKFFG